jgi:hypothetical protein
MDNTASQDVRYGHAEIEAKMNAAIFVISCWQNYARRQAIRATWAKLSPLPVYFVLGRPSYLIGTPKEPDAVVVNAFDDYIHLPEKVHAMVDFASASYDKILKVDDDAFVAADRFPANIPDASYVGHVCQNKPGSTVYCHGGAGYWLDMKAMAAINVSKPSGLSEDAYVARACFSQGIHPVNDTRYIVESGPFRWHRLPRASNDLLVTSEFTAEEMERCLRMYQADDREDKMSADEYKAKVLRARPENSPTQI